MWYASDWEVSGGDSDVGVLEKIRDMWGVVCGFAQAFLACFGSSGGVMVWWRRGEGNRSLDLDRWNLVERSEMGMYEMGG